MAYNKGIHKNVDMMQIEKDKLAEAIQSSRYLLDGKVENLEEEYKIINDFSEL